MIYNNNKIYLSNFFYLSKLVKSFDSRQIDTKISIYYISTFQHYNTIKLQLLINSLYNTMLLFTLSIIPPAINGSA